MKRVLGVILTILGSAIGVFCFLVVVRMLLNFGIVILALRAGDPSELLAFLVFVFCIFGGIALIILGRRLYRNTHR